MINKIYFDLDETLIHSFFHPPECEYFGFSLGDWEDYYMVIRPSATRIIDWARKVVGKENVHLLTIAIKDYALKVNEIAGWEFKEEDIFSREDIKAHTDIIQTAYGGKVSYVNPHIYANKNNVLIDNLPIIQNKSKMDFIGINYENYLQIEPFIGQIDSDKEDNFLKGVCEFISDKSKSSGT